MKVQTAFTELDTDDTPVEIKKLADSLRPGDGVEATFDIGLGVQVFSGIVEEDKGNFFTPPHLCIATDPDRNGGFDAIAIQEQQDDEVYKYGLGLLDLKVLLRAE